MMQMLDAQSKKPLIILEFANNHMGEEELYETMVNEFSKVASEYPDFKFAIKLQYRDLDTFIHPNFKGSDHSGVQRFESTKVSIADLFVHVVMFVPQQNVISLSRVGFWFWSHR